MVNLVVGHGGCPANPRTHATRRLWPPGQSRSAEIISAANNAHETSKHAILHASKGASYIRPAGLEMQKGHGFLTVWRRRQPVALRRKVMIVSRQATSSSSPFCHACWKAKRPRARVNDRVVDGCLVADGVRIGRRKAFVARSVATCSLVQPRLPFKLVVSTRRESPTSARPNRLTTSACDPEMRPAIDGTIHRHALEKEDVVRGARSDTTAAPHRAREQPQNSARSDRRSRAPGRPFGLPPGPAAQSFPSGGSTIDPRPQASTGQECGSNLIPAAAIRLIDALGSVSRPSAAANILRPPGTWATGGLLSFRSRAPNPRVPRPSVGGRHFLPPPRLALVLERRVISSSSGC